MEAINQFGALGTVQRAGGWERLLGAGIAEAPAGQALEAWRKGLLGELQVYLDNLQYWMRFNSKLASKADQVSGTMAALSEAIHQALRAAEEEAANASGGATSPAGSGTAATSSH